MATCARNVWLFAAMFNINFIVSHMKGSDNTVADLLSRWHQTSDNFQKLYDLSSLCGLTHIWTSLYLIMIFSQVFVFQTVRWRWLRWLPRHAGDFGLASD